MADFLTVITLIEYIIMLICHGFSIYYFGTIIYWSHFRKFHLGMNISMHFYIFVEFAFSAACIIFMTYLTILWRPDENIYDAYWIFMTGISVSMLLITQPLISCFLGLDRCLCLIFPLKNTKFWNKIIFCATVFCIGIFWVLEIPFYIVPAFPKKGETNCRSFGCLVTTGSQLYSTLRYITAVGSVIIGAAIIRLFSKKVTKQYSIKNTRLIVITLIAAILFDFVPSFISLCLSTIADSCNCSCKTLKEKKLFNFLKNQISQEKIVNAPLFFDINLTKLIGPFSTTFASFNSVVCGYQYYTNLGQVLKSKKIGFKSTTTTITGKPNLPKSVPRIVR